MVKISPPTQKSEITGKWFAGIYTVGKKVLLFVGHATKKFLFDSDSKPTYIELNCLKLHQPGCIEYIEGIPDHSEPYILVFSIHGIIAMISDVSYTNSGKWFFKNHLQIEKFFQVVKKIDWKSLL